MQNQVKLAKLVGAITMEMDLEETGQHLMRTSQHLARLGLLMKTSGARDFADYIRDRLLSTHLDPDISRRSFGLSKQVGRPIAIKSNNEGLVGGSK